MKDLIIHPSPEDGWVLDPEREEAPYIQPPFLPGWGSPFESDPVQREPCMFDGLPPGTYGLVCPCRRCRPWCVSF